MYREFVCGLACVTLIGCSSGSEAEGVCGNGVVEVGEVCDDGNTSSGDGCSNACRIEQTIVDGGGLFDAGPRPDGNPSIDAPVDTVDAVINEFVASHDGTDTHEYVEVKGVPSTDLSNLTILVIEGDSSSNPGAIQRSYTVGTTDGGGYFVTPFVTNELQNGSQTLLLVDGYTPGTTDIDTNDDGNVDAGPPWTTIVDGVAIRDDGLTDQTYATPVLTQLHPGGEPGATVGGASRIPDGTDTNAAGDWTRNDFEGHGLACTECSDNAASGEALNTPGAQNQIQP